MLEEALRNLEFCVNELEEKVERLEERQQGSSDEAEGNNQATINKTLVAQKLDNAINKVESILKAGQFAA